MRRYPWERARDFWGARECPELFLEPVARGFKYIYIIRRAARGIPAGFNAHATLMMIIFAARV